MCLSLLYFTVTFQGLNPEVVPSKFDETLPHGSFEDVHEYPVATATQKAVEVYQRLVVRYFQVYMLVNIIAIFRKEENPDDPPDLVIGGTLFYP